MGLCLSPTHLPFVNWHQVLRKNSHKSKSFSGCTRPQRRQIKIEIVYCFQCVVGVLLSTIHVVTLVVGKILGLLDKWIYQMRCLYISRYIHDLCNSHKVCIYMHVDSAEPNVCK